MKKKSDKKINISIMTFWSTKENYGQILQMYGLYTYLKNIGCDVNVIRYDGYNDKSVRKSFFKKIKNVVLAPKKIINYLNCIVKERYIKNDTFINNCKFEDFKNHYFTWTIPYDNYSALKNNPPESDIYICGSDMIWAGANKAYFLDFVEKGKKVAFSPSFGSAFLSKSTKNEIVEYMSTFDFLSIREKSGLEICKELGFDNVKWLPDPSLLLKSEDYSLIERKPVISNYIFMYLLGHKTSIPFDDIIQFKNSKSLSLIYRSIQGRKDNLNKIYPTVEEWLGYMHSANYIITNSFHGCVFSVIFKRNFLFLPLTGASAKNNERIYSFLSNLGLEDRIWKKDLSILEEPIEYDRVYKLLNDFIEKGESYLKNIISKL